MKSSTPSINLPPTTPGYNSNNSNNGQIESRFFSSNIIDNQSNATLPYWTGSGGVTSFKHLPKIEVYQNSAFIEDDEGIAESGL